jgi:transcriptional regulator with XRE-family HTH domain
VRHRKLKNRLRVLRAERGVTQLDLAPRAGLSPSRYWRIEHGYDQPTAAERARLAKALRVSVGDLGFTVPETEQATS